MGPYMFNVDMRYKNNFIRKNIAIPNIPNGFMNRIGSGIMIKNTLNTEICIMKKIVIQNNNITGNENVEDNNKGNNKIKKQRLLIWNLLRMKI